jgi:hypothetical protein
MNSPPSPPLRGGGEKITLMVRSASSRVSNHEATGEPAMMPTNRKTF